VVEGSVAVDMKSDRRGMWRTRRVSVRLPRIGLLARYRRLDPFGRWAASSCLLETFVDTLGAALSPSVLDESVASMISGLLDGAGCAIIASAANAELRVVAATGTWEGRDLPSTLHESGCSWAELLGEDPMVLGHGRKGLGLRSVRALGATATAVAFPIPVDAHRAGGLLVTFDSRRAYGSSFFAAGKLLAGVLATQMANERLEEITHVQADRISRLRSDVERMGVLLRRA